MKKHSGPLVEGFTRAPSRALLYACGYTEKQLMNGPFIGIANAWSDVVPGHIGLGQLARAVEQALTRTSADTLDMCCPTEDRQEGRSRVPSPVKLKRSHQVYVPACCPAAEAEDHRNVPETRH